MPKVDREDDILIISPNPLPQRIVREVGVTLCCRGLGMAQKCSDNWQTKASPGAETREGMAKVVEADVISPRSG